MVIRSVAPWVWKVTKLPVAVWSLTILHRGEYFNPTAGRVAKLPRFETSMPDDTSVIDNLAADEASPQACILAIWKRKLTVAAPKHWSFMAVTMDVNAKSSTFVTAADPILIITPRGVVNRMSRGLGGTLLSFTGIREFSCCRVTNMVILRLSEAVVLGLKEL